MSFVQAWGRSVPIHSPVRRKRVYTASVKRITAKPAPRVLKVRVKIYDLMIENIAKYNSLPVELLISLIDYGSGFDPNKVSSSKRHGLMQISIEQAQAWAHANYYSLTSVSQLLDPALNLRIGAWALAQARNHWSSYGANAYSLALCEYTLNRSVMMNHIAYNKTTNKLVIKNNQLYIFVNSIIADYRRLKSK